MVLKTVYNRIIFFFIIKNDFTFYRKQLFGVYYRVTPKTSKEIFFIQGLAKNSVLFTPDVGDGLIVAPSCLKHVQ